MEKHFYSHGKIILSGEYSVLDGAWAIALPARKGQILKVEPTDNKHQLRWKSYDEQGKLWFEVLFLHAWLEIVYTNNLQVAETLKSLLLQAEKFNGSISSKCMGTLVETFLEFPRNWGLGSSATLLSNLARWFGLEPYLFLSDHFKGSGCDIACAFLGQSILYQLQPYKRCITPIPFDPSFSEELFFLHLNKKQDTRSAVLNYNSKKKMKKTIERLSEISLNIPHCESLEHFKNLLVEHEKLTAHLVGIPPLKERLFREYPNTIKSLGAWGGDFALVVRTESMENYFENKGYSTLIPFKELILNEK